MAEQVILPQYSESRRLSQPLERHDLAPLLGLNTAWRFLLNVGSWPKVMDPFVDHLMALCWAVGSRVITGYPREV